MQQPLNISEYDKQSMGKNTSPTGNSYFYHFPKKSKLFYGMVDNLVFFWSNYVTEYISAVRKN